MRVFEDINQALSGQPDLVLSLVLVGVAIALLVAAAWAPPALKLAMAAWVIVP